MSGPPEEIAAEFLLHLTNEALDGLAEKIRQKVAGGLSDADGFLERARARRTAEYSTYRRTISDRRSRLVIVNGLVMRALEDRPANQERIERTKNWLKEKWGPTTVRQAQFVQRGMLLRAIRTLESRGVPEAAVGPQVETLFARVEEHTLFVEEKIDERKLGEAIRIRALQTSPNTFIVFGKGYARPIAKRGVRIAMERLPETFAKSVEESQYDYVAFIGEKEPNSGRPLIRWWTSGPWPG